MHQIPLGIVGRHQLHRPNHPDLGVSATPLRKPTLNANGRENLDGAPWILRVAEKVIEEWYSDPKILPSLRYINNKSLVREDKEWFVVENDKKPRQIKSTARESLCRFISVLLRRCDLVSLRVGVPRKEGFLVYGFEALRRESGLTKAQLRACIRNLKKAGYIKVTERSSLQDDGSHKGEYAIKQLTLKFFNEIGINEDKLAQARNHASRRLSEKATKLGQKVMSFVSPVFRHGGTLFGAKGGKKHRRKEIGTALLPENAKKYIDALMLEGMSESDAKQEAEQLMQRKIWRH